MKKIYLDNAATTQILPEVIETITEVLKNSFGNPSSTHAFGRSAKVLVETARKEIAKQINALPSEIVFTSCGTEGDNWILSASVQDLKIDRIITTKIEHHAVLHTIEVLKNKCPKLKVEYLNLDESGNINYKQLENLLQNTEFKTLVSLMHVNNEIGTVLDLELVGNLCNQYNALFHSDTVQSIGKQTIDVKKSKLDFLVASAHKFHGPKGIGFVYIKKNTIIQPLIHGGEQEKGVRAGTEAVHQIAAMAKALSLSYENLESHKSFISDLKKYAIQQLKIEFPNVIINGGDDAFYNILNIVLPLSKEKTSMILFHLDMQGIAVSRGSACQSGSIKPSHVLEQILDPETLKLPSLRLSFSHFNTKSDIDSLIIALKNI